MRESQMLTWSRGALLVLVVAASVFGVSAVSAQVPLPMQPEINLFERGEDARSWWADRVGLPEDETIRAAPVQLRAETVVWLQSVIEAIHEAYPGEVARCGDEPDRSVLHSVRFAGGLSLEVRLFILGSCKDTDWPLSNNRPLAKPALDEGMCTMSPGLLCLLSHVGGRYGEPIGLSFYRQAMLLTVGPCDAYDVCPFTLERRGHRDGQTMRYTLSCYDDPELCRGSVDALLLGAASSSQGELSSR